MAYSIGIWRNPDTTVYRWESDYGSATKQSGYVVVDSAAGSVRPCTVDGAPIGDLVYRSGSEPTGTAAGVNPNLFLQIASAILRRVGQSGELPETAHKFYG